MPIDFFFVPGEQLNQCGGGGDDDDEGEDSGRRTTETETRAGMTTTRRLTTDGRTDGRDDYDERNGKTGLRDGYI